MFSTLIALFLPSFQEKIRCLINFSFDNVCRYFNILLVVERTALQSGIAEKVGVGDSEIMFGVYN